MLGVIALAFSIWQFDRGRIETLDNNSVDVGYMYWLLPFQLRFFGDKATFLGPRIGVTFNLTATYPTDTYTGKGFQILLESSISNITFGNENVPLDSEKAREVRSKIQMGFHSFILDLPGLEYSPDEPNKVGIDGMIHWQVGPPNTAGIYKGYIRPSEGTADVIGAEYAVKWDNIETLELEITVEKSFLFLENIEALILGFLGSLLTVPALIKIFEKYQESRKEPIG